jgi:hypothetical protein
MPKRRTQSTVPLYDTLAASPSDDVPQPEILTLNVLDEPLAEEAQQLKRPDIFARPQPNQQPLHIPNKGMVLLPVLLQTRPAQFFHHPLFVGEVGLGVFDDTDDPPPNALGHLPPCQRIMQVIYHLDQSFVLTVNQLVTETIGFIGPGYYSHCEILLLKVPLFNPSTRRLTQTQLWLSAAALCQLYRQNLTRGKQSGQRVDRTEAECSGSAHEMSAPLGFSSGTIEATLQERVNVNRSQQEFRP